MTLRSANQKGWIHLSSGVIQKCKAVILLQIIPYKDRWFNTNHTIQRQVIQYNSFHTKTGTLIQIIPYKDRWVNTNHTIQRQVFWYKSFNISLQFHYFHKSKVTWRKVWLNELYCEWFSNSYCSIINFYVILKMKPY